MVSVMLYRSLRTFATPGNRKHVADLTWLKLIISIIFKEAQKAEITEREKEAEIDPLAPYLARMFGSGHGAGALTVKEATILREQCINDFKAKQLARQNLVQERFDKVNLMSCFNIYAFYAVLLRQ